MSPYEPGGLSTGLVNTYDTSLDQPERLRGPGDLGRFLRSHGLKAALPASDADLAAVRALRARVRAVFEAAREGKAVAALNELLGEVGGMPCLVERDGAWQLELLAPPDATPGRRLALLCATEMALVVQRQGPERLHICAADPCGDVFVDGSRNRSRRYCSDRCANRVNAAAFRSRARSHGRAGGR